MIVPVVIRAEGSIAGRHREVLPRRRGRGLCPLTAAPAGVSRPWVPEMIRAACPVAQCSLHGDVNCRTSVSTSLDLYGVRQHRRAGAHEAGA